MKKLFNLILVLGLLFGGVAAAKDLRHLDLTWFEDWGYIYVGQKNWSGNPNGQGTMYMCNPENKNSVLAPTSIKCPKFNVFGLGKMELLKLVDNWTGTKYVGSFYKAVPHGKGKYFFDEKISQPSLFGKKIKTIDGEFENNQYTYATIEFTDGSKYTGYKQDIIAMLEKEKIQKEKNREAELKLIREAELKIKKEAELEKEKKEKQKKLVKLENEYGSKCSGILSLFKYEKGTPDYEKCLFSESAKDFERKELARKEKERIEKQQKEQILIAQQKEIIKISKFTPEEKRAYDCEKTFGFKKGSGDFKDCIFKLYTISAELEKEELRVQIKKLEMANERQKQIIAQNKVNQQVYINENANQNAIADAMREANSIARGKALLEYSRTLNNRNRGTNCMITRHGIHSILNCR